MTNEEIQQKIDALMAQEIELPGGHRMYVSKNEAGGRTYVSDSIGGGVIVWDTCIGYTGELFAALAHEAKIEYLEKMLCQRTTR